MTTNTKTVAFVNLKGGVGKTTSAIGTAEALARLGHTVTVRDADPSGAATLWAHKALSAGRPLPFGVEVVSRFTVAAPAEEESWRSRIMEINKPMTTRNMLASTLTDYRKPVKLLKMRGDGAPALRHTQGERRAHVRRGEGGIMTAQAPCAKIARRDPDLADRMWATITVGGREVVDAEKRALGRRVCETCPLRTTCIADSLVGGWKDRNLIGGLDYRRRTVLSKLVCRDLGITARQLHDMPAQRVSDWLERHPDWADRTRLADSSDWRQRKRLQRRKRERLSVAPSFTDAASVPPAIQGVLF